MTSDTLWQKYIYNTPFDDEEMPLLNSRLSKLDFNDKNFIISGRSLYDLDKASFIELCSSLKSDSYINITIIDDYCFASDNMYVKNGAIAHQKSFCYLFQKQGFHCCIEH